MNKLFRAIGLFAVLASTYCYGQTLTAYANVPFAFHVGKASMPAGKYRVSEAGNLLSLHDEHGRNSVMHLTIPATRKGQATNPALEFDRYGNDYFLSKIWSGDSKEGQALPKGKRQEELARIGNPMEKDTVALETKNRLPKNVR